MGRDKEESKAATSWKQELDDELKVRAGRQSKDQVGEMMGQGTAVRRRQGIVLGHEHDVK